MSETTVAALLQPIKDRLEAATPGPWEFNLGGDWEITANGGSLDYVASVSDHGDQSDHDTTFIASAPTDQAKLIAALEAVEALASRTVNAPVEYSAGYLAKDILAAITSALESEA